LIIYTESTFNRWC